MLCKLGLTITAIFASLVSIASAQTDSQDPPRDDTLESTGDDKQSTHSLRVKNRFVSQGTEAPVVDSEPITVKTDEKPVHHEIKIDAGTSSSQDSSGRLTNHYCELEVVECPVLDTTKTIEQNKPFRPLSAITVDKSKSDQGLAGQSNTFKSPDAFKVQIQNNLAEPQVKLELNSPKVTSKISDRKTKSASNTFVDLSALKTSGAARNTNPVTVSFSSPTIDHNIVVEVGKAHRRISEVVNFQFGHSVSSEKCVPGTGFAGP